MVRQKRPHMRIACPDRVGTRVLPSGKSHAEGKVRRSLASESLFLRTVTVRRTAGVAYSAILAKTTLWQSGHSYEDAEWRKKPSTASAG